MIGDRGPSVVEAARYIQLLRDRVVIVKLGGELLDGGPVLERIVPQIAVLYRCGLRPLIVHGGGRQVDQASAARGIVPQKVNGRRITTPEVMQVLLDVIAGSLNADIVRRLRDEGIPARGHLEGVSSAVRCVRRPPTVNADGSRIDWGEVGDVVRIDPTRLRMPPGEAWSVPVCPSIGMLDDGTYVNVNADSVASRLAVEAPAAKLVLLTGVAGILPADDAAGPISELGAGEIRELLDEGQIIQGGMRAKVEEALHALANGVPRVHIISGRAPMTLIREIFTDDGCGTLILPD